MADFLDRNYEQGGRSMRPWYHVWYMVLNSVNTYNTIYIEHDATKK